jgi:hypothetical protein
MRIFLSLPSQQAIPSQLKMFSATFLINHSHRFASQVGDPYTRRYRKTKHCASPLFVTGKITLKI